MIVVRLLLLALVLNAVAPAPVAAATSGEPPLGLSSSETGELVGSCDCALTDPDEVARPLYQVLPNVAGGQGFAAIEDPFTEERVRLPFRPPMAG